MSYNVSFISLGCAKNQVNCEQMMAAVQAAGHSIQVDPEGADVVVVNTCGFLASACEEAIDNILEMAQLKQNGKVKKILVTGCMAQRYKEDVLKELPEVDGVLGTGSYGDIAQAIDDVMAKVLRPCHIGNIHTANQSGERILSTPPWYAYLRIAEGCDNHCAYCIIPSLRGKYRSRRMEDVLAEIAEGMPENIELTVICGTNKQTAEKLRRRHGENPRVHIRGYVKDMSLMLDSADLYLTKAGGISTTEAAIKGVPLVLADAVGGCESRNLEFFVEHGAAVTAKTEELGRLCVNLLEDRRKLDAMAQAIERLRMEGAAEKICDYMRQRAGK